MNLTYTTTSVGAHTAALKISDSKITTKINTLGLSMNHSFLRSTFAFTAFVTLLSIGCADNAPTVPPEVLSVVFLDADGNPAPLTLVDYSTRDSKNAITVDDLSPTLDNPIVPDAVAAAGSVAFTFTQLLDGNSVQTADAKKQTINGKEADVKVGKGDWENSIPVIEGFTGKKTIVDFSTDPAVPADYNVVYRPDGAVGINPADRIDQYPKPAVVVEPAGDGFVPGLVFIHLIAETGIKGISGKALAPAKSSKKEDIVLPDGRKVAATIVLNVQPAQ